MTNLTYGILPSFFWTLIMPIMWLVSDLFILLISIKDDWSYYDIFSFCGEQIRIFTNTFTLTPYNGAEALVCCRHVLLLSI